MTSSLRHPRSLSPPTAPYHRSSPRSPVSSLSSPLYSPPPPVRSASFSPRRSSPLRSLSLSLRLPVSLDTRAPLSLSLSLVSSSSPLPPPPARVLLTRHPYSPVSAISSLLTPISESSPSMVPSLRSTSSKPCQGGGTTAAPRLASARSPSSPIRCMKDANKGVAYNAFDGVPMPEINIKPWDALQEDLKDVEFRFVASYTKLFNILYKFQSTYTDDSKSIEDAREKEHTHLSQIASLSDKLENKAILLNHFSNLCTAEIDEFLSFGI